MVCAEVTVPASAVSYLYLHRNGGNKDWSASFLRDYDEIESYLPARAGRILDIGCGMAGIDVLLKRRYPEAELWLLDGGWKTGAPRAGYHPTMDGFSDREPANELLAANGIAADRWIDIGTTEHLEADLVISLASWGYHYPLSTYHVTGYCIADLRLGYEKPRGYLITPYIKRNRCAFTL
jgi:hypothetical protein